MTIFINASSNSDMVRFSRAIDEFGSKKNIYLRAYNTRFLLSKKKNKLHVVYVARALLVLIFLFINRAKHHEIIFETSHAENLFFLIFSKILQYKIVHILHDPVPHPGKSFKKVQLYNKFIQLITQRYIIFSPNKKFRDSPVVKLGGYEQGRPLRQIRKRKLVSLLGRLEPYKGLELFVDIARETYKIDPSIEFIMAGSGDITDTIIGEIPPNLNIINRYLSDSDFENLLVETTIICLPYSSTTQSGVMVDAWRLGCFVLATDLRAFRFYHGDVASKIIVNRDPSIWAEEIHKMIYLENKCDQIIRYYFKNHSAKKFATDVFNAISKV